MDAVNDAVCPLMASLSIPGLKLVRFIRVPFFFIAI
jgi:hypothetical protein